MQKTGKRKPQFFDRKLTSFNNKDQENSFLECPVYCIELKCPQKNMSRNNRMVATIIAVLLVITGAFYFWPSTIKTYTAATNEVVKLTFQLDKKFEFGEYYFDLANGKTSTFPLCFCLTENNAFPPECHGDIKYIYNNYPGTLCVPLNIGTGRCGVKIMSSSSFATMFLIPLEYGWTKPFETIVIGVRVPKEVPAGARLVVEVKIVKRSDRGKLVPYRTYQQAIIVKS